MIADTILGYSLTISAVALILVIVLRVYDRANHKRRMKMYVKQYVAYIELSHSLTTIEALMYAENQLFKLISSCAHDHEGDTLRDELNIVSDMIDEYYK